MNEKIKLLAKQAGGNPNYKAFRGHFLPPPPDYIDPATVDLEKFAELIVEAVLDEVKERAYYTGDRNWSDEVDRPWIQLEFGYGKLHDAKTVRS
jgi:hypothetical protein